MYRVLALSEMLCSNSLPKVEMSYFHVAASSACSLLGPQPAIPAMTIMVFAQPQSPPERKSLEVREAPHKDAVPLRGPLSETSPYC